MSALNQSAHAAIREAQNATTPVVILVTQGREQWYVRETVAGMGACEVAAGVRRAKAVWPQASYTTGPDA